MKVGLSEDEAKSYYDKIKTTKIGSNIGIRMTEDTLFQKFDFYKQMMGLSAKDVLDSPYLLTYDSTNEDSPTSVISKVKFLRERLNLTNDEIKKEGYKLFSFSKEYLEDKIKFLKSYLDFDTETIRKDLSLIIFKKEYITEKAEYFKKLLGFTNAQFKKYPSLFVFDIDLLNKKLDYLINIIGLNESQLRTFPKLLSLDCLSPEDVPTSVKAKVKFYHDTLGFGNAQFQKAPCLLQYDCTSDESTPTSIQAKIKFFRETLGLTNAHFQKNPNVLGYDCLESKDSPTSVPAKIAYYKNTVGLNEEDIRDNLVLLHLDTINEENLSSVPAKLKALEEIGITQQDIQKNTQLLLTPAQDIKDKYALWCSIFPDKRFMELRTWFITRLEKVYARYKYLSSKQFSETLKNSSDEPKSFKLRPNHLDMCESQFRLRFKVSSDKLMEQFPLSESEIDKFYEQYKGFGIEPPIQRN